MCQCGHICSTKEPKVIEAKIAKTATPISVICRRYAVIETDGKDLLSKRANILKTNLTYILFK